MAQNQLGSLAADAFINKARASAGSVPVSTGNLATPANYTSMSALDTRLTAINNTIYTQAQLDKMTVNDKIYAVRLSDDAGTL